MAIHDLFSLHLSSQYSWQKIKIGRWLDMNCLHQVSEENALPTVSLLKLYLFSFDIAIFNAVKLIYVATEYFSRKSVNLIANQL